MDWNAAGPAAIVGAVVATIGVFVVELWLKPEFARKRVARVLLTELRLNTKALTRAIEHRQAVPDSVSESIFTSQRGWEAVASDIHHLPEGALRTLLLVYAQLTEIDRLVTHYSRKTDQLLQLPALPQANAIMLDMQNDARLLGDVLPSTLAQIDRTVPHLERLIADGPPGPLTGA